LQDKSKKSLTQRKASSYILVSLSIYPNYYYLQDCEQTIPLHENELKNQCVVIGIKKGLYRTWSYYDENAGRMESIARILKAHSHSKSEDSI
jgi:hypothetical protein